MLGLAHGDLRHSHSQGQSACTFVAVGVCAAGEFAHTRGLEVPAGVTGCSSWLFASFSLEALFHVAIGLGVGMDGTHALPKGSRAAGEV